MRKKIIRKVRKKIIMLTSHDIRGSKLKMRVPLSPNDKQKQKQEILTTRNMRQIKPVRRTLPNGSEMSLLKRLHDGMWQGQRCFIIGGGESLKGFDWSFFTFLYLRIKRSSEVNPPAFAFVSTVDL